MALSATEQAQRNAESVARSKARRAERRAERHAEGFVRAIHRNRLPLPRLELLSEETRTSLYGKVEKPGLQPAPVGIPRAQEIHFLIQCRRLEIAAIEQKIVALQAELRALPRQR